MMQQNLGELFIPIKLDVKGLDREMSGLKGKLDGVKGKLESIRGPLLAVAGGFTAMAGVSVKAASDLGESINAVEVVFGDAAKQIHDFGKTSATSIGLSTSKFNEMATVTGGLLSKTGLPMQKVAGMTTDLSVRAADLASVFNTDVNDAMNAINMALRGETEAIRRYTGDVTDNTLQQYLMAKGIDANVSEMSQQEKTLLRAEVLLEQTSFAADDFANTSGSLANQLRIARANTENLSAKFGTMLLPAITKVVEVAGKLVQWFSNLPDAAKKTIGILFVVAGSLAGIGLVLPPIIGGFTAIMTLIPKLVGMLKLLKFGIRGLAGSTGIGLLIIAAILVWEHWDFLKEKAVQIWNKILDLLDTKIGKIILLTQPLILAGILIWQNWETIKTKTTEIWDAITTFLSGAWSFITGIFRDHWDKILAILFPAVGLPVLVARNWGTIVEVVTGIWESIKQKASDLWTFLKEAFQSGVDLIKGIWDTIKDHAVALWDSIKSAFQSGVDTVKGVIQSLVDAHDLIRDIWDSVKDWATDLWDSVKSLFDDGITKVKELITSLIDKFPFLEEAWKAVKQAATDLWDGVKGAFEGGINFVTDLVNEWVGKFGDKMAGLLEAVKKVAGVFSDDLVDGIDEAIDALRTGIPDIEDTDTAITDLGTETTTTKDAFVDAKVPIDDVATALDGVETSAGETTGKLEEVRDELSKQEVAWMNQLALNQRFKDEYRESMDAFLEGEKKKQDELQKTADKHASAVASATESWDKYKFEVSLVNQFLEEHKVTTEQILQAIAREWGVTVREAISRLADLGISANDTERMIKLLGENAIEDLRLIVTGADEASGGLNRMKGAAGEAGSGFQSFAGKVVTGVENIRAALRSMESDANSAFAAVGRANNAKIDDAVKGSRGNETGRRGVLNAQIRAINDGLVQLRNNLAREKAGSGNPQAVQRQYDARRKELEAQRDRLVKELRSISTMDTGGLVRGPGLFRVGPGVQEIVRYHGAAGGGSDMVHITLELDGEIIGERLVDLIRGKTGLRF